VLPINIFFNPSSKSFGQNYALNKSEFIFRIYVNLMLDLTLVLAGLFMTFQGIEYFISTVNINTGVYGSTFYMITGLHGAHVFIGTCFLFYCRTAVTTWQNLKLLPSIFYRLLFQTIKAVEEAYIKVRLVHDFEFRQKYKETPKDTIVFSSDTVLPNDIDHYGRFGIESFESAAWYWHFVDVVWIFVFGFVYIWSHLTVLGSQ